MCTLKAALPSKYCVKVKIAQDLKCDIKINLVVTVAEFLFHDHLILTEKGKSHSLTLLSRLSLESFFNPPDSISTLLLTLQTFNFSIGGMKSDSLFSGGCIYLIINVLWPHFSDIPLTVNAHT